MGELTKLFTRPLKVSYIIKTKIVIQNFKDENNLEIDMKKGVICVV